MGMPYNPPLRTCKTCGKKFIVHDPVGWVYKTSVGVRTHSGSRGAREHFFCSWGCLRKYEKAKEAKKHGREAGEA